MSEGPHQFLFHCDPFALILDCLHNLFIAIFYSTDLFALKLTLSRRFPVIATSYIMHTTIPNIPSSNWCQYQVSPPPAKKIHLFEGVFVPLPKFNHLGNSIESPNIYMQWNSSGTFNRRFKRSSSGSSLKNFLKMKGTNKFSVQFLLPPAFIVNGKVMFSVCLYVHQGVPCGPVRGRGYPKQD